MAIEASSNQAERFGIVVGGGPAPGLNGTISTMTLEADNRGREAVGIYCRKGPVAGFIQPRCGFQRRRGAI